MILAALLTLGPTIRVTTASAAAPQQVWAAADPRDSRRLIACGRMNDPADNLDAGYVITSNDAGLTWKRTLLENSTRWVSEESCAFSPGGTAYFIAGASDFYAGEPHHETGHMHFYVSRTGGAQWIRTWTRNDGWLDWTSTAASRIAIVVLANQGTDRLGHWYDPQPVAVVSTNNGRSFSKLITLPASPTVRTAVWTGGHVTLADGTILFSTSTAYRDAKRAGWGNGPVAVEIYAFDPATQTLTSRAVIHTRRGVPIFTSAIAQSASGRLFVAWVEEEQRTSSLFLAVSADNGAHWKTRRIAEGAGTSYPASCTTGPPIDDVRLAASGQNVGALWIANRSSVRFALSADDGATFGAPQTLASADTSRLSAFEVLPFNDYWLDATLLSESGHPNPQAQWSRTPGVGVVMSRSTLRDISLVAASNGSFHAFWIAPTPASFTLYTRTITISGAPEHAHAAPQPPGGCAQVNAAAMASPALPLALPQPTVTGARDVTASMRIEPVRYAYDAASQTVSADVRVTAGAKPAIAGRLLLVGLRVHSDFGTARAQNANGRIKGQPYWNVTGAPVHIVVHIEHFKNVPSNYLFGDGFSMAIRILRLQQ